VIQFSTLIVGTIIDGCLFALIAIGFVVVYRATAVVSFAQGAFMVLGSFIFFSLTSSAGLPAIPAFVAATIAVGLIAGLTYRVTFARMVGAPPFVTAIATIGVATTIEAIAIMIWGDQSVVLPANVVSQRTLRIAGDFTTNASGFITVALAVATIVALVVALQRTKTGLRMRVVADDSRLAAYSGVNVSRVSTLAWAVAGITAALAGIAFTLPNQPPPDSTYSLGLLAFPAILLGGFDSIIGALVGGLLIALVENAAVTYIGGQWQEVVSYGVLLVVLFIRPQGLFGKAEVNRL
jgi:branched-chain amino acid transport system permease protein